MKKGDLIRLVTRKTRFSDPEIASNYSYMEYRIPKEEQEIGIIIQEGDEYVKQMKVLSRVILYLRKKYGSKKRNSMTMYSKQRVVILK